VARNVRALGCTVMMNDMSGAAFTLDR